MLHRLLLPKVLFTSPVVREHAGLGGGGYGKRTCGGECSGSGVNGGSLRNEVEHGTRREWSDLLLCITHFLKNLER